MVARQLPDTMFIWVGGMPFGRLAADNKSMQNMIDNPPENMKFTGVLEHEAVKQYYQAADVFWLPSEQETFGLVVVEAAASSLPILLRDIPDYQQTFAGDAILCNDDSIPEMIHKLRQDSSFYKKYTDHASRISERYDSVAGANHVVEIYKRLLG